LTRVAVVIPTWNGRELLATLLPTLAAQRFRDFRTIVVDNGSSDGTVEWLALEWPAVEVLALPANLGFAPAVNRGVRAAHEPYVALLNNDMELDPGWLEALVDALDADPRAGAATPKQRSGIDRERLDGAGDLLAWTGGATRRGIGELDRGQYDAPGRVFGASAGAALYRRAALEQVGAFDESFESYLEDVDWALRAQMQGWHALYVPHALAYHLGGATAAHLGDRARYLLARNYVWMIAKDYPAAWLARFAPQIAAELARILFTAVRDGQARVVARAWRDALRRLPDTLERRRAVQARCAVPLPALEQSVFGARRGWRELFSVRPSGETFGASGR
jgi:GT2 family glycosyltransferase